MKVEDQAHTFAGNHPGFPEGSTPAATYGHASDLSDMQDKVLTKSVLDNNLLFIKSDKAVNQAQEQAVMEWTKTDVGIMFICRYFHLTGSGRWQPWLCR